MRICLSSRAARAAPGPPAMKAPSGMGLLFCFFLPTGSLAAAASVGKAASALFPATTLAGAASVPDCSCSSTSSAHAPWGFPHTLSVMLAGWFGHGGVPGSERDPGNWVWGRRGRGARGGGRPPPAPLARSARRGRVAGRRATLLSPPPHLGRVRGALPARAGASAARGLGPRARARTGAGRGAWARARGGAAPAVGAHMRARARRRSGARAARGPAPGVPGRREARARRRGGEAFRRVTRAHPPNVERSRSKARPRDGAGHIQTRPGAPRWRC
jgi:hypothetical protein